MCGFAGFINLDQKQQSRQQREQQLSLLRAMGDALVHRGPDQQDQWLSPENQVGFAHRRLAIIDLTDAGKQPMTSQNGRWVIAYNGEVYNYLEVADQLKKEGIKLIGGSDTEVILEAIAHWGLTKTLERMHGMFAFALYDQQAKQVMLVRDRLGEKPLYVGIHEGKLLFGSELKAFYAIFTNKPVLHRSAIGLYLRHGYIPAPYTVYNGIFKLPPAHQVTFDIQQVSAWSKQPEQLPALFKRYWNLIDTKPEKCDLHGLLQDVIAREMRSDVPLGAFLSGGVDSSTIVALMQAHQQHHGGEAVKTFSIGFEEERFNEAPYAAAVAEHLQTQHHEQIVTTSDVQSLIPQLAKIYDEPFADSSQLPTILVSQLARQHVTVSLSGDGGDELFAGYERYQWANSIWQKVGWLPSPIRQVMASMLTLLSQMNTQWSPANIQNLVAKFERLAAMLSAENRQWFYRTLISAGVNAEQYVLNAEELPYALNQQQLSTARFVEQMMSLDMHSYLPDDILTKVDRASMSVSLESRVPLLDHAIVEQAWLQRHQIDMHAPSKQALRTILYQYVPQQLIERPKRGFAIPLAEWLRGDLRQWADELLAVDQLAEQGVFSAEQVDRLWRDFKYGKSGAEHLLWSLLMFQLWYRQWHQ